MRATTHIKVSRNMEYHQKMAEYYESLDVKAAGAAAEEGGEAPSTQHTADEEYLAALHADVAKQLQDVLGGQQPPAILGAEPPVTRASGPVQMQPPARAARVRG